MNWYVFRKVRKSGQTIYEVTNNEITVVIFTYKELIKFMEVNK